MADNIIFPTTITTPFDFTITPAKEGLYAVSIAARCRGVNDDLRIELEGRSFRELPPLGKPSFFDIPPAWNGSLLKGQTQTVVLILWLAPITYTIRFIPRGAAEIVREPSLLHLPDSRAINFLLNDQATDANGRPWYALVLVDVPLASGSADVSVSWHWFDGDDLKLIVDGRVQPNLNSRRYHDWLWSAGFLNKFTGPKRETKSVSPALPRGIHYLEFWADRTPTIHTVTLDLGADQRLPTREAPRWTGNFADDIDQLLLARMIFGEARGVAEPFKINARIAVGWTVRNRIALDDWRGRTYHEVILKEEQYSAFNISERNKDNRLSVENPFRSGSNAEIKSWFECYKIAGQVIDGLVADPASGATNYYDESIAAPPWAIKENFKIKIGPLFFYRV